MTLNANLQPEDSPITNSGAVSPYSFDGQNERGVINAMKIKSFSFNSGTGGTLTLGGTENGSGFMQLKDENGTLIFTADYEGHHYYGTAGTVEQIRVDELGFHAYGTSGTAQELVRVDDQGFHGYNGAGTEKLRLDATGFYIYDDSALALRFRESAASTSSYGFLGYQNSGSSFYLASGNNKNLYLFAADADTDATLGAERDVSMVAGRDAYIITGTAGDLFVNGFNYKMAIVPTSKGYNALYTNESPEVWFMDFCESRDKVDPLFLEVTVPPYHYIKCEDGEYQVWGKRKGAENVRFENKTQEEFEHNNRFWSQGRI